MKKIFFKIQFFNLLNIEKCPKKFFGHFSFFISSIFIFSSFLFFQKNIELLFLNTEKTMKIFSISNKFLFLMD